MEKMNSILELMYVKKYNHILWSVEIITFVYFITLLLLHYILFSIISIQINEQNNFNLFIGTFTISTVLISSLITTLIQNKKRNNSIIDEYYDVFEYLRNLNWYLYSGLGRCRFLESQDRSTKTKKELILELKGIKDGFDEMDSRIRNMVNANSTFPSTLKNQIYITLDQSSKIFGTVSYLGTPHIQDVISNVFIKTNFDVIKNSFLNKYADEEVMKTMISCINSLSYSVNILEKLKYIHSY